MELKLITEFNESTQYRSKSAFRQTDARTVCDHAFMDMIALWILYNENEFAPWALEYASRTVQFNRFTNYRQMGTDLYLNLHVITEKRTDLLGMNDKDLIMLDRVQLDVPNIVRYLRMMSQNNINQGMARMTLQKLEHSLHINNSNYRSVRRIAQNWPNLATNQKRMVITRMNFFYQMNARRSEVFKQIKLLGKSQGLIAKDANNPEIPFAAKAAAAAAAGATGYAIGHRIGKSLL